VLSLTSRLDPFATARHEAGLVTTTRPRRAGAARRPVLALTGLLAAVALVLLAPATGAAGAGDEVARLEARLRDATAARIAADERVEQVGAQLEEVRAELERLGAADERLLRELTAARRQLREYAVAAYIDGGQSEIFRASLSPEKAVALAWQSNMTLGQSVSADDAAARFEALREANEPERLEAAAELDRVSTELQEARFDAIQAAAHERDAESALSTAREAARRAREQRAAEERAERRAAQQRQAADRARRNTRPAARPAARAAAPAAPAATGPAVASSSSGNPTAWESSTLARIRACESGGNYRAVSSSGRYRGAYQFDRGTWASIGGSGDPAAASPAEQDYRALLLLRQRGTRPWPVCGR